MDWVAGLGGAEHTVDAVNTTLTAYDVVPEVAVQVLLASWLRGEETVASEGVGATESALASRA